ncbi:MAG: right-handed parallel beta-helix repeat-containing protein [Kofleriaceae bacterium]
MRTLIALAGILLGACGSAGGGAGDGGLDGDGGVPGSCEPFGRYGVPATTFTLPATGRGDLAYGDVQAAFPEVDWATLDRLYLPAGTYTTIRLENLPVRTADRPLVITNLGGQVKVGPNLGGNFIWAMSGGANWILTGRYDPTSMTGDAGFPGHRCGAYANSRGTYGFLSDDAFDLTAPYLHMGLAVAGATDFELEYLEITRSGFAGIRLLNARGAGDPAMPMANVRVHDTYVHDTDGEGFYFGWTGAPPSNLFPGLQVYNNRILRTGTEALQLQDLGDGSHVHHNVLAFAALHWLDAFGNYQDGNNQILVREGAVEIDHNLIIGGAGTLLSFFSAPEPGDGERQVVFHDNHYADTRNLGGYLNGTAAAPSSFTFRDNTFRGLDFSYAAVDPAATDPGVVFGINPGHQAPIVFAGNTWDGDRSLVSGLVDNGTRGSVTATGNTRGPVAPVAFVDSGYPDEPVARLTLWGDVATLAPGQPPIEYAVGDLVMYQAELYRARTASTGQVPPDHPEAWAHLPPPADDVRTQPGSPYAALGVR